MALINCPECGKEISDKAISCSNCGNPIQSPTPEEKEYLVCPKCGSKELHSQKKGFSGGKAVAGAVLTGGIGLLAGTIGSKDVLITCLKCGNRFKAGDARIIKEGGISLDQKILNKYHETESIVPCVQLYKNETNSEFSEATRFVTRVLEENSIDWKAKSKSQNSGCMLVLILIVSVGSIFALYLI